MMDMIYEIYMHKFLRTCRTHIYAYVQLVQRQQQLTESLTVRVYIDDAVAITTDLADHSAQITMPIRFILHEDGQQQKTAIACSSVPLVATVFQYAHARTCEAKANTSREKLPLCHWRQPQPQPLPIDANPILVKVS